MSRTVGRHRFAIACLSGVIAALAACTQDSSTISGSPGRGIEQDINATHNVGPTSAQPGKPREATSIFSPTETPQREALPSTTLSEKAQAAMPSMGIAGIVQSSMEAGDPRAGRNFAFDNCRPCHVVAPDQSSAVRFADAPDFHAIANAPVTTPMGLIVWLTNPHPTMPTLVLSPQEARDVITYILSLRDGH